MHCTPTTVVVSHRRVRSMYVLQMRHAALIFQDHASLQIDIGISVGTHLSYLRRQNIQNDPLRNRKEAEHISALGS